MNARLFVIAVVLVVGFGTIPGSAQRSTSDQGTVDAYRAAIRSAESAHTPRGIESAFSLLVSVRKALLETLDGRNVMESLPEGEFRRLRDELPGAIVNREEVLFVEPDPDYFTKLAVAHGDEADRAFFSTLKTTYPDSVWPVYVDQQTDYSGCTRFGSMSLIETYRVWADFQQRFPGRYPAGAKKETDAVIERLTTSTCACGDLGSVESELRQFIRAFPTSSARVAVDQRLQALQAGRAIIRASCMAG